MDVNRKKENDEVAAEKMRKQASCLFKRKSAEV